MSNAKKDSTMSYNFGAHGWGIIIYQIVCFFFMTGMTVDGLNTIVPGIAAVHPEWGNILGWSTPAGIIALFICLFWGKLIQAFGLKRMQVITLILAGVSTIAYGMSSSLTMYIVALIAMVTLINAFANIGGNAIVANWFPIKKGLVLGLTTIGMNLASALINWFLTGFASWGVFGEKNYIGTGVAWMGVVILVLAVITILFIHETPEEVGCIPDNDPELAKIVKAETKPSTMTYGKALADPKTWIISVATGFFGICTVGIMSQLVSFLIAEKSFVPDGPVPTDALVILTIAAIIGIVGSWLWGVIDQKFGTRTAMLMFGFWFLVGNIFLIIPGMNHTTVVNGIKLPADITTWIGLFMLGCAIGGNGNFCPSMTSYVFKREDFPICISVNTAICGVIRNCAFVCVAFLTARFQGFTVVYIIFGLVAALGGIIAYVPNMKNAYGQDRG